MDDNSLPTNNRVTYTGVVTSLDYNGKTTRLDLNNGTIIYIYGVVNGVTIGDNYRIVVEKQESGSGELPYKLISIKKW
jgi:hypothetical protein